MTYFLDKAEVPTIPVPHDCVINDISFSNDFLVLDFEQDISRHDSIKDIHSNAKSFIINLYYNTNIILNLQTDYIEYIWKE